MPSLCFGFSRRNWLDTLNLLLLRRRRNFGLFSPHICYQFMFPKPLNVALFYFNQYSSLIHWTIPTCLKKFSNSLRTLDQWQSKCCHQWVFQSIILLEETIMCRTQSLLYFPFHRLTLWLLGNWNSIYHLGLNSYPQLRYWKPTSTFFKS